jgi:hypothetical protein
MAASTSSPHLSVGQFVERHRREMIPLTKNFSYYCASLPLTEEDLREYLKEPIASLPPSVAEKLPKVSILLVPYLEKPESRGTKPAAELIRMDKPSGERTSWSARLQNKDEAVLVFALKDQEMADYHYRFFQLLASLMAESWTDAQRREYSAMLRDEIQSNVHGEVDERSWHLKVGLDGRVGSIDSKAFREYARHSFIDTLTLYLHGICCDIDVETGPRQLPSRCLRKRLEWIKTTFPPPTGYAVFPEDLKDLA